MVAQVGEAADEGVSVHVLADSKELREGIHHPWGTDTAVQGAPGEDERAERGALPEVEEGAEALRDNGSIGADLIPGKDLITWEMEDGGSEKAAAAADKESEVCG